MKRKKNVRFRATMTGQDEDLARLGQLATMPSDELMETEVAILSGGHDQEGRPIITFPAKNHEVLERRVKASGLDHILTYFISLDSAQCQRNGFAFVVDMRRGTYELISIMKSALNSLQAEYKGSVGMMYAIQPHAKQLAKDLLTILALRHSKKKKNKHLVTPLFQSTVVEDDIGLHNYIDRSQLTTDLGGYLQYSHIAWLRFRSIIEPFFEKYQALQPRLPIGFERMEELKKYNVGNESTQLHQTRQAMLQEYDDIREDIGIDHVYSHCEDLMKRLKHSEDDRLFGVMAQKPIFLQSKRTLEMCFRSLKEAMQHIERLWREGEKRIVDAEELAQFQNDVKEVSEWLHGPGLHELKKHTEIASDAGRAELLRSHFDTSCLSISKSQLARVDALFQQADVMLINNNANIETIQQTVKALKRQTDEFSELLTEKESILNKVHRFFVLHKQVSKWYWKTLQFLPPDLPDVFNELKSKTHRKSSDLAIHEWQEDVKRYLKKYPPPSGESLKELKSTSDVILRGKLRRQARLLSHRCSTLKKVLDIRHVPSSKDILDALQWQESHQQREEAKESSGKSSNFTLHNLSCSDTPDGRFKKHNRNNNNSVRSAGHIDRLSYGSVDRRTSKKKPTSFTNIDAPNGEVSRMSQGPSVRPKVKTRTARKDSDQQQDRVAYHKPPVGQRPYLSSSTVDIRDTSMNTSHASSQDSPFLRALRQAPRPTSLSLQYINSPQKVKMIETPKFKGSSEQKIIDETYGIYGESEDENDMANLEEVVLPSRFPRNAYAKSWVHSINSGQWPTEHDAFHHSNGPLLSKSNAQSMPLLNHVGLSVQPSHIGPDMSYGKPAGNGRRILDPQIDYLSDRLMSSRDGPSQHSIFYSPKAQVFHSPPEYTSNNNTLYRQSGLNCESMTAAEIKQITPPNPPSASDSGIGRFNSDSNLTYSDVLHNISLLSEVNASGGKTEELSPIDRLRSQSSPSAPNQVDDVTGSGDSSPLRGTLGLTIPMLPFLADTGSSEFEPEQPFLNASLPIRDRESPNKLTPKENLTLRRQNSLPSSLMHEKTEHLSDFVPKDGRTLTSSELADFEVERERLAMQELIQQDKLTEERESQRALIASLIQTSKEENREKRTLERKLPKVPTEEPVDVKISADVLFQINEGLLNHQNGMVPRKQRAIPRHESPVVQHNYKAKHDSNSYSDDDDEDTASFLALLQQAKQQSMATEDLLLQERLRYEAVQMEHEEIIQKDLENRLSNVELTLEEEETILQQEALLDQLLKDDELASPQYKSPGAALDQELSALEDKERLLQHQILRRNRSIPLSDEGVMLDQVSLDSMEQGSIATTEKSSVESGLGMRYNRHYNYGQRPRKSSLQAHRRAYTLPNGHL
ncbi:uncharacterized protein LOC117122833 [Anneissia japonica]|uniref:uncharacterized protein LOC117122833 n=1 Tax=Anneissia japonica TaxID=1529436 RepID=UPI001425928D|nr:uncharacterized protein LOC117122833 [Anneissia japonica]